jgi:hypothetical protein
MTSMPNSTLSQFMMITWNLTICAKFILRLNSVMFAAMTNHFIANIVPIIIWGMMIMQLVKYRTKYKKRWLNWSIYTLQKELIILIKFFLINRILKIISKSTMRYLKNWGQKFLKLKETVTSILLISRRDSDKRWKKCKNLKWLTTSLKSQFWIKK